MQQLPAVLLSLGLPLAISPGMQTSGTVTVPPLRFLQLQKKGCPEVTNSDKHHTDK